MRYPLLFLTLLFSTLAVTAQYKKGDARLSIKVSPYFTQTTSEDDFGAIGLIGLDYFISDRVSMSTSFFTSNNSLFQNDSNISINAYGVIPSIQYHFLNLEKVNLFGQLGYGFGFSSDGRTQIDNQALRIYNIGIGVSYPIHKHLGVSLLIPYFNAKDLTFNREDASGVAIFIGLDFNL